MPATNGGDLLSGALTADEKDTIIKQVLKPTDPPLVINSRYKIWNLKFQEKMHI